MKRMIEVYYLSELVHTGVPDLFNPKSENPRAVHKPSVVLYLSQSAGLLHPGFAEKGIFTPFSSPGGGSVRDARGLG